MEEKEARLDFSKRLNAMLEMCGKTQVDVAKAIDVGQGTFNSWCVGRAIPRMAKIDKLCDYFGCTRADLLQDSDELKTMKDDFNSLNEEHQKMVLMMIAFLKSQE